MRHSTIQPLSGCLGALGLLLIPCGGPCTCLAPERRRRGGEEGSRCSTVYDSATHVHRYVYAATVLFLSSLFFSLSFSTVSFLLFSFVSEGRHFFLRTGATARRGCWESEDRCGFIWLLLSLVGGQGSTIRSGYTSLPSRRELSGFPYCVTLLLSGIIILKDLHVPRNPNSPRDQAGAVVYVQPHPSWHSFLVCTRRLLVVIYMAAGSPATNTNTLDCLDAPRSPVVLLHGQIFPECPSCRRGKQTRNWRTRFLAVRDEPS